MGFLNFIKPSRWVRVGYSRFLTVLPKFFCGFLQSFCGLENPHMGICFTNLCGYLFHKPTHGFASFPTQILMKKTHKKHMWFCITFPVN